MPLKLIVKKILPYWAFVFVKNILTLCGLFIGEVKYQRTIRKIRKYIPHLYEIIFLDTDITHPLKKELAAKFRYCLTTHKQYRSPLRLLKPVDYQVVYVTNNLSPDVIKDTYGLEKHGYKTLVLYGNQNDYGNLRLCQKLGVKTHAYCGIYDLSETLSMFSAKATIARRGDPYEALISILMGPGRKIYKPHDFVLRYPSNVVDGLFRNTYPHHAEITILKKTDSLFHHHENEAISYIREQYGFTGKSAQIRPGCIPQIFKHNQTAKLSNSDGKIHIVYAAGLARINTDPAKMGSADQYKNFKSLVQQGIHVHVYAAYNDPRNTPTLSHYIALSESYPNFHLEKTIPYEQLMQELPKYDYGYCHFPKGATQISHAFLGCFGNNVYSYLDAGLPLIGGTFFWGIQNFITSFDIGVVIDQSEIQNTKKILDGHDIARFQLNINRYAKEFSHRSDLMQTLIED